MGLEISYPRGVGGITPNIYIDRNRTMFREYSTPDTFERTGLDRFSNETTIKTLIAANPKIKNIVKNFNPEMTLNMKELDEMLKNHATDTRNITKGIADNLPFALKSKVDIKALEDSAYLHDIGKVLIPIEILNKPAKLNEKETKIMNTHSELSYELLKNSNLDDKTLKLIRNHHQNANGTGYPCAGKDFRTDINLQILSAADKYSALREERAYKQKMSPKQSLTIIYQDVKDGKLHPFVFKALADYSRINDYAGVT